MGKLVSTSIPNLINGVSQQPDSIRLPTQAKEVVNCFPSVVEFLKRRQATRHRAKIKSGAVGPVAQHTIDRDVTERYSVLVADGDLTVTDLDGTHKTVNFPAGKAYLATATPNTDIAFLTINDYTFILHRKKVTSMLPDLTPTRTPEALVFIKQASYGTTYKVIINGTGFEHNLHQLVLIRSRLFNDDLAFAFEISRHRATRGEFRAVALENVPYFRRGPVFVVRQHIDHKADAAGCVTLVGYLLKSLAGEFARALFDSLVNVVVRHVDGLGLLHNRAQCRVHRGVPARFRRKGYFLCELAEHLAALCVRSALLMLDCGPFAMTAHLSLRVSGGIPPPFSMSPL